MAIDILMPALSPTMETGTLAKWMVAVGDSVRSGDVIAEIETDKATMEVEAVDEGVLASIMVEAGAEGIAVGTPIARLAEDGESVDDVAAAPASSAPRTAAPEAAAPEAPAPEVAASEVDVTPAPVSPAPSPQQPAPAVTPAPVATGRVDRVFASPLARRIAADRNIDLATLSGSGPHGRILRRDVEAAGATAPAVATASAAISAVQGESRLEPNSQMRKIIAARLQESKTTAPHFYLTVDCEIDNLLESRRQMNDRAPEGVKISVNDLVIRAAAMALIKVPKANASWEGDNTRLFTHADIAMAVAVEGGLVTPVIWAAEKKGLAEIASITRDLATRARDGKLAPEEFSGGSFTISNLGMYGVREFAAVINPPQGAILAIGAGEQRPVVHDGQLAVATVMTVTLSADHRVVDGAVGAQWLQAFKGYIEAPVTMLL
ncbi:MAG: pyruvate dehydrogenase complex dihydrolipoamide acetyltransferase [Candidatus Puniceispirillaceae bacterium]